MPVYRPTAQKLNPPAIYRPTSVHLQLARTVPSLVMAAPLQHQVSTSPQTKSPFMHRTPQRGLVAPLPAMPASRFPSGLATEHQVQRKPAAGVIRSAAPHPNSKVVQPKWIHTGTGINLEDNFWTQSAGYLNEAEANIAGNFPVIDNFDAASGTATSLKAMDVMRHYKTIDEGVTYFDSDAFYKQIKAFGVKLYEWVGNNQQGWNVSNDKIKRKVLVITVPNALKAIYPKVCQEVENCVQLLREHLSYMAGQYPSRQIASTWVNFVPVEVEVRYAKIFENQAVGYKLEKYHEARILGEEPGNTKTIDAYDAFRKEVISYKTFDFTRYYQSQDKLKKVKTNLETYLAKLETFGMAGSNQIPAAAIAIATLHVSIPPEALVLARNGQGAEIMQIIREFESAHADKVVVRLGNGAFHLQVTIEEMGSYPEMRGGL